MDGDVCSGRGDDDVAVNGNACTDSGRYSGGTTGVPSASRHTRTVPSAPPLMMTGVPSGSARRHRRHRAAWPFSGSPTGCRRPAATPAPSRAIPRRRHGPGCHPARRHSDTTPLADRRIRFPTGAPLASSIPALSRPPPPLTMTGVPSGSAPPQPPPVPGHSGSPTGAPSVSRHTRTVPSAAAADDDRGAVRQRPGRHRAHPAVVAVQRLPDRGAVGQPPHPHGPVVAAADDYRGAIWQRPGRHRIHPPSWPRNGSPTGVPSASRHTRTVASRRR